MQVYKLFGHDIAVVHCPHQHWYNNAGLDQGIRNIMELSEVKNRDRGQVWDSHYGEGETSEVIPYLGPANLPDAQDLLTWIKQQATELLKVKSVDVDRSWTNRMEINSQGRCHNHVATNNQLTTPDLVAVFYVNNPPGGSSLIIVDQDCTGKLPSDIDEIHKEYITPSSGDLIMHGPEVCHGVSEHKNTDPRICFVYQLTLTNK
jgi:hypothetical protein